MKFILFPRLPWPIWRQLLSMAMVGTLVAATFGVIHDEITCTLSPDYFTKLKFPQFHAEQFGLPFRGSVAVIGALASWWVGLIAAWVLARLLPGQIEGGSVHLAPPRKAWGRFLKLLGLILTTSSMGGFVGFWVATPLTGTSEAWREVCQDLLVKEIPAFLKVACIHQGTYIGAALGFLIALLLVRRPFRS
jgi:predicted membrane protein